MSLCETDALLGGKKKSKSKSMKRDIVQPTPALAENTQNQNLTLGDDLLNWLQASSPMKKLDTQQNSEDPINKTAVTAPAEEKEVAASTSVKELDVGLQSNESADDDVEMLEEIPATELVE